MSEVATTGVGFEHLLDALTHVTDGIDNVRSEAMENVEHAQQTSKRQSAAKASRSLAVRSGGCQP